MSAATATPARRGEVASDVLRRAKSGDQRAFTEVVRHYDHRQPERFTYRYGT